MTINILNSEIINQIAAGEVIENPSSVVKELIENSIDAKSDRIEIILENAGIKKIFIKDNGEGILKQDLIKAPLKYATSKIKEFNDLYNINSMGFRGEALASIFSIAKVVISSKPKSQRQSFQISSKNLNEIKISHGEYGTQVLVEDLFYNIPARKKYLKSENKELKLIIEIVTRYMIYYNNISFILKHNGKLILNKPKFDSKLENIYYILGKNLKENLLKINLKEKGIKISGFISNPSNLTYSVKKNQYLFVNSRFVKSKLISDAIYQGFGTNLMEGRHPLFILEIQIDPQIIDVNVHPTKIEIKFENELEIFNIVRRAIHNIFLKNDLFKSFEVDLENKIVQKSLLKEDLNKFSRNNNLILNHKKKSKSYFSIDIQKSLEFEGNKNETNFNFNSNNDKIIVQNDLNKFEKNFEFNEQEELNIYNNIYGPLYNRLKKYRILGQINKTFIILETPTEMIIIDQHVAEEKFYFEKFKFELKNSKVKTQKLLKSKIIEFSNSEIYLYKENKYLLDKLGFETEFISNNSIIVRKVPIGIRDNLIEPEIIPDILHEISLDKKFTLLEEKSIEKLASISCKKSIKAGNELTKEEIIKIIEQLKKLKEPFNCPHGRPILLNWSFKDLEKKFKRIL